MAKDKVLNAGCGVLGIDPSTVGVNFSFVDENTIRGLNNKFRGVDKVTDVLSFPNGDVDPETEKKFLGDVLICRSVAKRQARELGQSVEREITFLKVHGLLHLLGYDHENEDDEKNMIAKQEEIMTLIPEWLADNKTMYRRIGKWTAVAAFVFALFGVFMWRETNVERTFFGLSVAFGGQDGLNNLCCFLYWLSLPIALVVLFSLFYPNKMLRLLRTYFVLPIVLVQLFALGVMYEFIGDAFVSGCYCFLIALTFVVAAVQIGFSFKNKDNYIIRRKDWLIFIVSLVGIILCTMPLWFLQAIWGRSRITFTLEMGIFHRFFIYLAFLIPVAIYLFARKYDEKTRRLVCIFLSVAWMITFSSDWMFESILQNPYRLPLHLCNTVMWIIPICLIFKLNKVFYFTLFINVIGSFLAMFFPENGDNISFLFDYYNVMFWVNHWAAFFMPILCVCLGIFERPKLRHFIYSMIAFAVYYLALLFINPIFTALGRQSDYFFLNGDTITSVLGEWAEEIQEKVVSVNWFGLDLTFRPEYQFLFFLVYVILGVGMWFMYELFLKTMDGLAFAGKENREMREERRQLKELLNGRALSEPVDKEGINMLQIKNFSKRYGGSDHYAVKDANLTVNAGEVFGFLGPNGAGKSTIIKSIVGIQRFNEGEINVCGFDVLKQSNEAKSIIGFCPDNYALYEKLTGREYVNYFADIYKVSKEDRTKAIESMLDMFEIRYAFDSPIRTYSHGMKKKISIMSALVHNPKIWILDEPLSGLDPNSVFAVKETMKSRAKEGNVVFFSSHIIDVVERVCDRIAIIRKGKIIDCIAVADIVKSGVTLENYYMDKIGLKAAERDVDMYIKPQKTRRKKDAKK